jgi:hypothetical protein
MRTPTLKIALTVVALVISSGCASLLGGGGGAPPLPDINGLLGKIPKPNPLSLASNYEQAMSDLPYLAVSKGNPVADAAYLYGNQNFK